MPLFRIPWNMTSGTEGVTMQGSGITAHFFMNANTPQGFLSRADQLYNVRDGWKAYILKGGPGTGKSEFVKKVGEAVAKAGYSPEYIHSVIDDSIEGVVFPALKTCVIDGTPPRSVEPKYPGVVETVVQLGDCWNEKKLFEQHEKIVLLSIKISSAYDRVYRFLAASSTLQNDTYRLAYECTDTSKIDKYAIRIAKREFTQKRRQGRETQRFLSGITSQGVNCHQETLDHYNKVFVIEDEFGIGRLLLSKLRNYSLSAGYDVISCYCPSSPADKLEHLLIPSLSIAFVTSNHYHKFDGKEFRHIHIRRFLDLDTMKLRRHRIAFNRRASRELISEAVNLLSEIKSTYDTLKSCYTPAMNFEAVDQKTKQLIDKILNRSGKP